jgi:phage shock protein PspC (stress-responsive transcriptional regulator)
MGRRDSTVKRLYRYPDDGGMIGGVCEGLGRYFEIDLSFIRIVWGLLMFGGVGIALYIICWIAIPAKV